MEEYKNLLKKAYSLLPEKTQKFERFEPPQLKIVFEGSKAIIQNFYDICEKLRRDKNFVAKYFGKELAVPVQLDGQRLFIFSKIPQKLLEEKYQDFIKFFVICSECKRPDTKIILYEGRIQMLSCEACGAITPIRK
ncbi:MAG: translation initiation factor IF-2 subunit beta [Candidatus Anstonellaceae archaeon]